jgi:inhibitor of cysteine peptidase
MQKRFPVIALALSLLACSLFDRATPGPPPLTEPPVSGLTPTDPDQTLEVTAGEEFQIVLDSTVSTGYHWELTGELDAEALEFVSSDYVADQPIMPGSGGSDVWTFKALSPGETGITLGYFPPSEGEPAQQEVTFTVVIK